VATHETDRTTSKVKGGSTVGLMNLDFVSLGALFLLSLVGPAFVAGGEVVTAQGTNTPVVVVTGLIGAAGIGALLQLTGRAIWNFFWPLNPVGGWKWLATDLAEFVNSKWRPTTFRTAIAESKGVKEYTDLAGWSEGDNVVIATEYLFYSEAPSELREWVRRRYYRFSDGLSAAAAILLGIIGGAFFPHQNPYLAVPLDALLVLVGLATLVFGYDSRRDAKHMETFWFKARGGLPSKPHIMISDIEGIGPVYAAKLESAGVRTTEALLKIGAKPKGRADLEKATGISHAKILEWVDRADLYRIDGVASEYSDLLEAAGVDSPVELATRVPAHLAAKLQEVNKAKKLVRRVPTEKAVEDWIEQAKRLPKVVEH
jgi:predicted flap endonuclease-1-like 5' DNA nuclease